VLLKHADLEVGAPLNLFWLLPFHWLEMLVVAERDQLPVAQARAGDPAAWDALFRRYQLPLYVYVFELVHDEQASLDIVQESFINATRYIGGLREDDKFGGWLFGIVHQKCVQRWRKQSREQEALEELATVPTELVDAPDDLLISQEQEEEFMGLLNQLPPPQRSVLLLYFVEDFSVEEITKITGAAVGTVKSRLHYAKRALRKLMEEAG
jgi:RNA polymerase sigma-70 factor (ECF subfamily)